MSLGKLPAVGAISRDTPLVGEEKARDPRVENVAKLYEKQFLREMVKAMRSTVSESELTKPSMAEEIYRGQLDEQYVEAWGDNGGVGLADLIYNELMEKVLGRGRPGAERPSGPINLSDRDILRVQRLPATLPHQAPMKVELAETGAAAGPARVTSPWDGTLLAQTRVDGKTTVLLEHRGGLRSALMFDGVPASLSPGQKVQGGAPVGILAPEIRQFFWNLNAAQGTAQGALPGAIPPTIEKNLSIE